MKAIVIGLLLLIIFGTAGFVTLRLSFSASRQNYFNLSWRYRFDRSQTLRNIFNLHDYGDARGDYLGLNDQNIALNVYEMSGMDIDAYVSSQIVARIAEVTNNKNVSYTVMRDDLPLFQAVSDNQINTITNQYADKSNQPGTAVLNLFIFSKKSDQPDLLGVTWKENGIIIFQNALKDFTQPFQQTFDNYELSTIVHEFGHQLGLEHNELPGCLMNPKAELNDNPQSNPEDIVTDFCQTELDQIRSINY